ncbi:XrtA/PEP-CTERM system histidine kinase PrsK [Stakelama marina]|uniref:histidine kinase n=1 Tax=Stakelama marina TaxID=2826939 RepID=A0A8T4IDV3_9SPHN|nr:XrtA/PEP-CTERM system histidine kinase PrsK [Stakelama marina]MBR0553198.1 PEP-CTERM system histidine kinase PrsK [Stakelama marina]
MAATLTLWTHALAALLFAALALWTIRRDDALPARLTLGVALAVTTLWALGVAGIGPNEAATDLVEGLRNLSWLTFILMLHRRGEGDHPLRALRLVYGVVALVFVGGMILSLAATGAPARIATPTTSAALLFRMLACVASLVILQNLYATTARATRVILLGIAVMWCADCLIFAVAYLSGNWPAELGVARGLAMLVAAAIFAVALQHRGDWTVRVSRTFTYQSLSVVAIGLYLAVLAVATSALAAVGGAHARILQTAFVFGSTAAILTLVSTPWLRAWARVKLAKHLFRHRYDYRAEWVRFTDTLGDPESATPLGERIVKAIADLTESPAGLLLVPDGDRLGIGPVWNWNAGELPAKGADGALAGHLAATGHIIELDAVRAGRGRSGDEATPEWMRNLAEAWVLVPLIHFGRLTGAILLARPPIDRALDWEDFDLLRIAGRQVASYLAEERAQAALGEAQRFEEFNRRFAFILHDIKNLVSQLTLVARNAERHADNPEFRADMVATLTDSAERMSALLARLSQHGGKVGSREAVDVAALVERVASARRAQHPVVVVGAPQAVAIADPVRLEQLLGHLVQNALEASPAEKPVTIAVSRAGGEVAIDVIDEGCGMSAGFIRDRLFRPFVSTKAGGFGIGAFESLQLAQAMDGTLDVASREGEGTRFRLTLPVPGAETSDMGRAA